MSGAPRINRAEALERVLVIAREAAKGIAQVYAGQFDVEYKGRTTR